MQLSEWQTGSPPMIGWWNASTERDPGARRWWNGQDFSAPTRVGETDAQAELARRTPAEDQDGLEWRGCLLDLASRAELVTYSKKLTRSMNLSTERDVLLHPDGLLPPCPFSDLSDRVLGLLAAGARLH